MAGNKTKPTKSSVAAFINALTDQTRRANAETLVKVTQRATGEKPRIVGGIDSRFGSYHYTYDSGREGDMPLAGFSPRKAAIVLYIMTGFNDSEVLLAKLGKHTTGKVCLYAKKLTDVDQKVLEELVAKSVAQCERGMAPVPAAPNLRHNLAQSPGKFRYRTYSVPRSNQAYANSQRTTNI